MASSSPSDSHDKTTPTFLYTISKVQVVFPVKPYKVQMYALVKIIKALNTTTNTMLELPTGSGKTLALLCGTLAWQRHELAELTRLMQQQIEEDRIIEEQIMEIDLNESEISIHTEETINASESVEEENTVTEISDQCICPDRNINESTCKSKRVELDECSVENNPGVLRREKQRRTDNEEEENRGEEEKTNGCSSNEGKQLIKPQQEIMMNTVSSDDENTDDFAEKPKNLTKMTANQNRSSKTSSPNNNRNLKSLQSKVSANTQKEENSDLSTSPLKSSHEDVVQQNKYCRRADNNVEDSDEDLEDFCVRPRKITKKEDSSQMVAQQQSPNFKSLSQCSVAGGSEQPSCSSPNSKQASQQCEGPKTQGIIPRVPKMYYCSRSHAQLNQVIAELRKTEYKDVNMTVLSSREFTCIQKRGSARNKTELCNKLLDPIEGYGCMYYHNVSGMSTHSALKKNTSLGTPWDIEDLVTAGRKLWACPYFTARELIASADIVFCPYIYLIDPKISSSMKLDIAGAIIILDEAHNIEDCCREAASYSVSCYELEEAVKDCRRVATLDVLPELHNKLAKFLTNLLGWISEKVKCPYVVNNKYGKEKTENVFSGVETTVNLEKHNITLQDISQFKNLTQEAMTETNKEENKAKMRIRGQRYGIVPTTKSVLLGISYVMGFMYDNNMQHLHDYFVVISKTPVLSGTSIRDLPEEFRDSEANELRSGNEFWSERNYFINFLCMNSAVIFKPISKKARTIVLASGTLSPLDTYESELGAVFPFPISTSHIIGKEQVFVAAVSQGPTGKILLANYAQTQNGPFKDELGSTILEICKCVPYGVLCFLPSYSLLKTLEMRWTETKLWSQLEEYKIVMCEPQNSREYPAVVEAFQNCVKCCEQGMGNGPLLFAVMRGKASEGMNFADNMARAVISVGIPYPHLRNILVILKRYYNTTYCRAQKLENGEVWYRTQAYRALNQALGRCIRHSKDWGALIMIDERLTSNSGQINSLSKWIGENMQIFKYYAPFHSQLKSFIKSHVEADIERK